MGMWPWYTSSNNMNKKQMRYNFTGLFKQVISYIEMAFKNGLTVYWIITWMDSANNAPTLPFGIENLKTSSNWSRYNLPALHSPGAQSHVL